MSPDRPVLDGEPAGLVRRLRGRLVSACRRRIARPALASLPLGTLEACHRSRRRLLPSRYTDAPAFDLIEVDPNRIEWSLLESAPARPQWGRVVGGDWDRRADRFEDRAVYRGLCQRYRDGYEWAETALVDAFADQLRRFGTAWGYTSMTGFENRCTEIDRLYESVREHGYRRQAELIDRTGTAVPRLDEINVDVGRDGTLYWRSYGQHRLAIAKLLALESVPVLVHRRHRRWQAIRDRVRTDRPGDLPPSVRARLDHPDLRDLDGGIS
ncbi:hypothetical protein [Natrialbaceae archaeon AArc-T1-2]|uniref:hypothetical protein n=1 Tax=Natrialbaceae archaeon AArc-T1-2 TaxID=3053904 RepID=UPI00255B00AC|nr:hypothetical protein [Natrialbaceae archaeon AArc-T1-2]WIV65929.1 hypothetical protein QQ977_09485 [Natrialbaceae archaeon AArc-T1-2]